MALYEAAFAPGVIEQLVSPEVRYILPSGDITDRQGLIEGARRLRAAFSDLTFRIDEITAVPEGYRVRWTMTGTHDGHLGAMPPTFRRIRVGGEHVESVVDGIVVARSGHTDHGSLMQQLSGPTETESEP